MRLNPIKSLLLLLLAAFPVFSFASALGIPLNTQKIGLSTNAGLFNNVEPEGKTKSTFVVQPLNFIVTDWLPIGRKYWLEMYYTSIGFEAKNQYIGEEVRQAGAKLSMLYDFETKNNWHPWLGVGGNLSQISSSKRHLVDEDGYLIKQLENHKAFSVSFVTQLAAEWHYSSTWHVGLKSEYQIPVTDSFQSLTISLYFLHR